MDEKASQQVYRLLNTKHHWRAHAEKLRHGANVLFEAFVASRTLPDEARSVSQDTGLDDVATLLYGLAMENLVKAVLLREGKVQIDACGTIAWKGVAGTTDHDLVAMCRPLKFLKLNPKEEKLLERLSAFVCWAGKYPKPLERKRGKDFKGFHILNQPNAAPVMMPVPFGKKVKTMFEDIYKSITAKI